MAVNFNFTQIYSNDGETLLFSIQPSGDSTATVTSTGVEIVKTDGSYTYTPYTYEGDKIFAGLATAANATEAVYKVGDTFTIPSPGNIKLYIVEGTSSGGSGTATITFDLSSLGLPTGTYSIHVKLNGDGYRDSDASNIVEYTVEGSSTDLISFTINGISHQAEEGMTWAEWVESEYNTDGYRVMYGHVCTANTIETWIELDQKSVTASETIANGAAYILFTNHGGGSN